MAESFACYMSPGSRLPEDSKTFPAFKQDEKTLQYEVPCKMVYERLVTNSKGVDRQGKKAAGKSLVRQLGVSRCSLEHPTRKLLGLHRLIAWSPYLGTQATIPLL